MYLYACYDVSVISISKVISVQNRRFGLISLFYGISTFVGYLVSKPSFKKNNSDAI